MRNLIGLFLFFTINSWAMKPLPVVELTPELSKKLDFRVSFEVTNNSTVIFIAAPTDIDSCSYKRNFVEIINSNGDVVATTQTNASVSTGEVQIDGFISDLTLDMRMGITYLCLPKSGKKGKIYLVNSIKKYLISTQQ